MSKKTLEGMVEKAIERNTPVPPKVTMRDIPNDNQIAMFFHCGLCTAEVPDGVSPQEYADNDVGFTVQGFQVWCNRHECNIIHMDFEGTQHPANTNRRATEGD